MSKAFCCDNCHDLFGGSPYMVDNNGNEFCAGCVRVMKAFRDYDPMAMKQEVKIEDKSRCHKCVYETYCIGSTRDREGKCSDYKRDAPDGGYYG